VRLSFAAACFFVSSVGLSGPGCEDDPETDESDVIVNTESELQWKQYVANVDFVEGYVPRCTPPAGSTRPRVIVTGFGRFLENKENATGRMVSRLVPGLAYPETQPPPKGEIDDPAAQTRVMLSTVTIDGTEVDVCGMVLPVFWDVAAILVLKEADLFRPDFVMMNGIAGNRQPLWIELGSVNEAVALPDGSGTLQPIEAGSKLVDEAPDSERARGLLLSWQAVRAAAEAQRSDLATEPDELGTPFGDLLQGVLFAGFPRSSNTYLCNNTTYVVNYVFDHPGETFRLLEPSHPRKGGPTGVDVRLASDLTKSPRVFVHWAKDLAGSHLDRGAEVMGAIIGAQLGATTEPTRGDASMADFTD
jgi:pyrrolidone-carboxylate peptidase